MLAERVVSCLISSGNKSADGLDDVVSSFCPYKRFSIGVMSHQVISNRLLQCLRRTMCSSAQLLLGQGSKESLDQVDPTTVGRGKVNAVSWMT